MVLWQLDSQLPMQSVTITTNVVSSNSSHGEVYSIQLYVTKFVSDLWQVCGFLRLVWFPPTIKLTTEILLKVALNIIILTLSRRYNPMATLCLHSLQFHSPVFYWLTTFHVQYMTLLFRRYISMVTSCLYSLLFYSPVFYWLTTFHVFDSSVQEIHQHGNILSLLTVILLTSILLANHISCIV